MVDFLEILFWILACLLALALILTCVVGLFFCELGHPFSWACTHTFCSDCGTCLKVVCPDCSFSSSFPCEFCPECGGCMDENP